MRDIPEGPGRRFATLIRTARIERGLTQEDLVDQSGVSRSSLLRWEKGEIQNPDPVQVRKLITALGLDPREAIVALGLATRQELNLPPQGPKLAPPLTQAQRLLDDPKLTEDMKRDLTELLEEAIRYWHKRQGLQLPREPSAAERARKATSTTRRK